MITKTGAQRGAGITIIAVRPDDHEITYEKTSRSSVEIRELVIRQNVLYVHTRGHRDRQAAGHTVRVLLNISLDVSLCLVFTQP